jgi:hypothetical protein
MILRSPLNNFTLGARLFKAPYPTNEKELERFEKPHWPLGTPKPKRPTMPCDCARFNTLVSGCGAGGTKKMRSEGGTKPRAVSMFLFL